MEAFASETLAAFAAESGDLIANMESSFRRLFAADGDPAARLTEVRRKLHTLKGAAAAVGLDPLVSLVHDAETVLSEERLPDEEWCFGLIDQLRKWRADAPEGESTGAGVPEPAQSDNWLRVRPERVEGLHDLTGEFGLQRLQHEAFVGGLQHVREQLAQLQAAGRSLASRVRSFRKRPEQLESEQLLQASGDIQSLSQDALKRTTAALREAQLLQTQAASLGNALEAAAQDMRLMPVQAFFESFAAAVREAARSGGKKVVLEVRAGTVELDRMVLTRLRDPLLHLVRNAVVHGIEPADKRLAAAKAENGTLLLEAVNEGSRAVLRIVDDGAGIDVARVADRARQTGVEIKGDLEENLLDVLTTEGFTTRDVADDLAGRGVGLDVVASTVNALGGKLTLDNVPGAGCIFTISVPVRATNGRGLVVQAGERFFGILAQPVAKIIRIDAAQLVTFNDSYAVEVAGRHVGVVLLEDLLTGAAHGFPKGKKPALLIGVGRREVAIVVDDIPGEQAMIIKPFGPSFANTDLFIGGALQADGSVLPVLNATALVNRAGKVQPRRIQAAPAEVRKRTALVVDDSLTMRTLERNILQTAGLDVVLAQDGRAALETFAGMEQCDLVVTDLQMPFLDGAGVCAGIRQSNRPNTPVIVVTSVDEPDEKRRVLTAGADAYLLKQAFEQGEFLKVVQRLTGMA